MLTCYQIFVVYCTNFSSILWWEPDYICLSQDHTGRPWLIEKKIGFALFFRSLEDCPTKFSNNICRGNAHCVVWVLYVPYAGSWPCFLRSWQCNDGGNFRNAKLFSTFSPIRKRNQNPLWQHQYWRQGAPLGTTYRKLGLIGHKTFVSKMC